MALHRLASITMGVPNVADTSSYYADFGLTGTGDGRFATIDGGDQLHIVHSPTRRLVELVVAADHSDDLDRIAHRLDASGFLWRRGDSEIMAEEPVAGIRALVRIAPRIAQAPAPTTPYNGPGRIDRLGRAPGITRDTPIRPRKLGHAVIGSIDYLETRRFFVDGLGFKISDHIKGHGTFMRCSEDHHNVLVLQAPVNYLHHTSWQVEDIDEVGRGAFAMLEGNPERHVWGLGRHHAGSNFFWYLKDPAGNFAEYYSDMDCIPEDSMWTPEDLEGAKGLFNWGPPPPPSFLNPEDLAAMMTGAHSGR
ncbi:MULTISPECIES: VOC family protein [unclassified Rhodococcus (in: high G+C Gram-positive bacteria)]|uniref:VOC family protein n=1 Tax=Rhodococcus sp. A14 TaxID=1194106 RepID=UPI000769FB90|nr:dioxygenase [Rhodococcus sp. SC4]NHU47534.1 dioxygenase [Rhodococcus sp. A14]